MTATVLRQPSNRQSLRVVVQAVLLALGVAVVIGIATLSSCSKHTTSATAPGGTTTTPRYTIAQSISDEAQRNTLAFDGLAFLNGCVGAQSFLPPGTPELSTAKPGKPAAH